MKIPFRQGIVSHQSSGFLFYNNVTGYVDLRAQSRPTLVSVAHHDQDYLFSEDVDVPSAWKGTFDQATDYWLYWDFDFNQFGGACPPTRYYPSGGFTCKRTFKWTEIEPLVSNKEPPNPLKGQMWYDTANHKHYEWSSTAWVEKLRVFACKLEQGRHIIPISFTVTITAAGSQVRSTFTGTQIGDTTDVYAGRPLYTEDGIPIKRDDGTFFTTEDQFFADKSRVDALRLESNVIRAQCIDSAVSEFSVVAFNKDSVPSTEDGRVRSAVYSDVATTVIGVVTENLQAGEVGQVIVEGVVSYTGWEWLGPGIHGDLKVGDELWVDNNSRLVPKDPHLADPLENPNRHSSVARILSNDSIIFQQGIGGSVLSIGEGGHVDVDVATESVSGISRLSIPAGSGPSTNIGSSTPLQPVVVETTDERLTNARDPNPHFNHKASDITFDPSDVNFTDKGNLQDALEDVDGNFVLSIGDSMTGFLTLHSDPNETMHAATKQYVDRLTTGLVWQEPLSLHNMTSFSSVAEPTSRNVGDVVVVGLAWGGYISGQVVQFEGELRNPRWEIIAQNVGDFLFDVGLATEIDLRKFGVAMDTGTDLDNFYGVGIPSDLAALKNQFIDYTGNSIYNPYGEPPTPAVSISERDYPTGVENPYALNAFAWNGTRWIKTAGSTISFGNWIHGNHGSSFQVDPEALGEQSAAIGSQSQAIKDRSMSFGFSSASNADDSIAFGSSAQTDGENAIAIGSSANSDGIDSISIGTGANSTGGKGVAIGFGSSSTDDGIAIGQGVSASAGILTIGHPVSYITLENGRLKVPVGGSKQIVLPNYTSPGPPGVGISEPGGLVYTDDGKIWAYDGSINQWIWINGVLSWIHANKGSTFVDAPNADATNAIAAGQNASISNGSENSIAIGTNTDPVNDSIKNSKNSIAIGTDVFIESGLTTKENSVAIGHEILVQESNIVAIGYNVLASKDGDIAIGREAVASGTGDVRSSISIGERTIAGPDSVVIGAYAQDLSSSPRVAYPNVTVIGAKSSTNRPNSIVIGDECYIDTTDTIRSFHFQNEFIKIGTSAGSEMFIMMLGDPASTGAQVGGQLVLRGPQAQYVLPKYNPADYYLDHTSHPVMGLPDPDPTNKESISGGLIYDLEHDNTYDSTISPPGPAATKEPRVKVLDPNGPGWVPVGAEYLHELKDVDIDYSGGDAQDMKVLTYENGQWIPFYPPVRANSDKEFGTQPNADGDNSIASGDGAEATGDDSIAIGTNTSTDQDSTFVIGEELIIPDPGLHPPPYDPMSSPPVTPCPNFTTMIGRGSSGSESYMTLAEGGQFTTHGKDAQIILPSYPGPVEGTVVDPVPCSAGMIWDESAESALIWDGINKEWKPLGGGGGGIIEVPPGVMDPSIPLDATSIGRPVYFDSSDSSWKAALADDITKVHVGVISEAKTSKVTIMLVGECIDINHTDINEDGPGDPLVPGAYYYLSITQVGKVTSVRPLDDTDIVAPIWQALSAESALMLPYRAGKREDTKGSISSITDHNDGTFTHNDGKGTTITIDTNTPHIPSKITLPSVGREGIYEHDDGDGTKVDIDTNTPHNPSKITLKSSGVYTHDDGSGTTFDIDTNTPIKTSVLTDNLDGTYEHNDGGGVNLVTIDTKASSNPYDNTTSGLTATTVQDAIDEILITAAGGGGNTSVVRDLRDGTYTHNDGSGGSPSNEVIIDTNKALDDLTNVSVGAPTDGQVLTYNLVATSWMANDPPINTSLVTDNADGTYTHSDGAGSPGTIVTIDTNTPAIDSTYDNTNISPGLTANNVQGAIDELASQVDNDSVSVITNNADGTYEHDDGTGKKVKLDFNADALPYDNTLVSPGLVADNVQDAIDEVNLNVEQLEDVVEDIDDRLDEVEDKISGVIPIENPPTTIQPPLDPATDWGSIVYFNGTNMEWTLAQANDGTTIGVAAVNKIDATGAFSIVTTGMVEGIVPDVNEPVGALVPGDYYYLSEVTPGKITAIKPTTTGNYIVPVYVAITTDSAMVLPFRADKI